MRNKVKTIWFQTMQFIEKDYDSILLFVSLFLLFYLCMHLVKSDILLKKVMVPDYRYTKSYFTNGEWTGDDFEEAWHVLEGAGVNCMLRWIRPTIGPASEKSEALLYLSAEALAKKEKLDLRLWNETPNSVMIEGRMKPMSYMREGKRYISIDGLEFRVLDIILKNELMAYNIHVNWKNLDEEHQRIFLNYQHNTYERFELVFPGFPIYVQSLSVINDKLASFEKAFSERVHDGNYTDDRYKDQADEYTKMQRFYLIMGFFVATCFFSLSDLWFRRRKREYLIRRMLGSGGLHIWLNSLKDAGSVTLLAFVGATFILLMQLGMHVVGKLVWYEMLWIMVVAFMIAFSIEGLLFGIYVARILEIYPTHEHIEKAE